MRSFKVEQSSRCCAVCGCFTSSLGDRQAEFSLTRSLSILRLWLGEFCFLVACRSCFVFLCPLLFRLTGLSRLGEFLLEFMLRILVVHGPSFGALIVTIGVEQRRVLRRLQLALLKEELERTCWEGDYCMGICVSSMALEHPIPDAELLPLIQTVNCPESHRLPLSVRGMSPLL